MRSTLILEDSLMLSLKEKAAREHMTLKAVVNKTLKIGLGRTAFVRPAWKCQCHDMGSGFNYTKAWEQIDALEADAVAEKMELRK